MRKSKIVHVKEVNEVILVNGAPIIREDKSIDTELLDEALDSVKRDAVKVNKKNYLASRRFRVNTVALEKAFKKMRELSPVKKKK